MRTSREVSSGGNSDNSYCFWPVWLCIQISHMVFHFIFSTIPNDTNILILLLMKVRGRERLVICQSSISKKYRVKVEAWCSSSLDCAGHSGTYRSHRFLDLGREKVWIKRQDNGNLNTVLPPTSAGSLSSSLNYSSYLTECGSSKAQHRHIRGTTIFTGD